jgi:hypothetical protein
MVTYLATKYLFNLAKRAATDGHVATAEIVNTPKLIDKVYGDGDGVFEMSDVIDAATEIGGNMLDKAERVLGFLGGLL